MAKNLFTIFEQATKPTYRVVVAFPFDTHLSKNKQHGITRHGKMYTLPDHRRLTEELLEDLKDACAGHEWKKEKYWVSIHVQKPTARGDCVNYVDAICDVVKVAIGIDDNWMELERVSFEIARNEENLKIFISVAQ